MRNVKVDGNFKFGMCKKRQLVVLYVCGEGTEARMQILASAFSCPTMVVPRPLCRDLALSRLWRGILLCKTHSPFWLVLAGRGLREDHRQSAKECYKGKDTFSVTFTWGFQPHSSANIDTLPSPVLASSGGLLAFDWLVLFREKGRLLLKKATLHVD